MGKNSFIAALLVIGLLVGGYYLLKDKGTDEGFQSTQGDVIRTVPINGDGSFTVTYSSNQTGNWGAIIEDRVTNCLFSNGKTTYKSVMLGDGPTSQTITVNGHACKFVGDYNLITSSSQGAITNFGEQTVK